MAKITKITLKNGTDFSGYYNGKNYNGIVYINEMTPKGIDWKHSTKINFADIQKIKTVGDTTDNAIVMITTKITPKNHVTANHVSDICPRCHTYCYGDCQA